MRKNEALVFIGDVFKNDWNNPAKAKRRLNMYALNFPKYARRFKKAKELI